MMYVWSRNAFKVNGQEEYNSKSIYSPDAYFIWIISPF